MSRELKRRRSERLEKKADAEWQFGLEVLRTQWEYVRKRSRTERLEQLAQHLDEEQVEAARVEMERRDAEWVLDMVRQREAAREESRGGGVAA